MINDTIKLIKVIGKGTFGNVFLGKNLITEKYYAIKKVSKKKLESAEGYKYFNNEIFILKRVKHPNIIKFEGIIEYKSDYYLLTEYCNGGNLNTALKYYLENHNKPLPENIVRYFIYNILVGIVYLNQNNLIHRDIKGDNILLHYEKEEDLLAHNFLKAKIKIIDFGFSRYLEHNELAGSFVGTPTYMEPTLLKAFINEKQKVINGFYDKKVDIWSLGVLTYELLMGIVPFLGDDLKGLYECVSKRDFIIPIEKKRNFKLSEDGILFIDRALNKDINLRPLPEELLDDPWITNRIDENKLYQMKNDSEIAESTSIIKFQDFWKLIKKRRANDVIIKRNIPFFSQPKNTYIKKLVNNTNDNKRKDDSQEVIKKFKLNLSGIKGREKDNKEVKAEIKLIKVKRRVDYIRLDKKETPDSLSLELSKCKNKVNKCKNDSFDISHNITENRLSKTIKSNKSTNVLKKINNYFIKSHIHRKITEQKSLERDKKKYEESIYYINGKNHFPSDISDSYNQKHSINNSFSQKYVVKKIFDKKNKKW